ncbi:MAG: hypothetical protein AB1733_11890 [Thermodesulfobacteriota bacterium]
MMQASYSRKKVGIEKALDLLHSFARKERISRRQVEILESYLRAIPTDSGGFVRLDTLVGLLNNFQRAIAENDSAFLEQRRGYRTDRVVDVIEFAESREFCALKGSLWTSTKEDLWKIFHNHPPPFEVLLTGAAGTAKSTKSWISTGYSLYLLSCLWNPQLEMGMAPVDEIFLIFQSMRLATATDTLYERLRRAVDASPYFQGNFPRNRKKASELLFPNHVTVKPVTGATDAVLGLNVIAGVITEINFMPVRKDSVKLLYSDKQIFDVGMEMYRNLRNRIIGRYKQLIERGDFVGRLILDSARNHTNDFAAKKIEHAKRDSTILIVDRTLWNARSHEYPPGTPTFLVELGTDYRPPRIITGPEEAEDPENVLEIPMVFRTECEQDLEQALKDLAGVPSTSTGRFLPFPKEISQAQDRYQARSGGLTLFRLEDVSFRDVFGIATYDPNRDRLEWELLINGEYLTRMKMEGDYRYCVHVDMSLSGDATGLALGRIVDTTVVEKTHYFNPEQSQLTPIENLVSPVYLIDGVLRIHARPGEQIDINIITDLVLELHRHIQIRYGSADWMESAAMLQRWRANRITTGRVSVDKSPASYFELKHAIREGRILFPPHQTLDRELRRLKRITQGGTIKIDHETSESKDCSDAVAGVVGVLQRCEHRYQRSS